MIFFSITDEMSPDTSYTVFRYLTMWYIGRYKLCLGIYLSGGNCLPALARPDRFQPRRNSPTPAPSMPSPPTTAKWVMQLGPASMRALSVVATTASASLPAVYNTKINFFTKFYKYNNFYTLGTRTGKDTFLIN